MHASHHTHHQTHKNQITNTPVSHHTPPHLARTNQIIHMHASHHTTAKPIIIKSHTCTFHTTHSATPRSHDPITQMHASHHTPRQPHTNQITHLHVSHKTHRHTSRIQIKSHTCTRMPASSHTPALVPPHKCIQHACVYDVFVFYIFLYYLYLAQMCTTCMCMQYACVYDVFVFYTFLYYLYLALRFSYGLVGKVINAIHKNAIHSSWMLVRECEFMNLFCHFCVSRLSLCSWTFMSYS